MNRTTIHRPLNIPDTIRIERARRLPELGPNILFFSGGSALTSISQTLKKYTYNSAHIITTFDSGGSSAKLRKAFGMPAIGDLRSRLIALADESELGHPEITQLFKYRFAKSLPLETLQDELQQLINGQHPLIRPIPEPMQGLIKNQLIFFNQHYPDDFDLQGASIGNLILAGGYLNNQRQLDLIIYLFSKLVGVKGKVQAISSKNIHLYTRYENGLELIGQHKMTGKEVPQVQQRIKNIKLNQDIQEKNTCVIRASQGCYELIEKAELICFPPGSFYSSLLANLLPEGISDAIVRNPCPKIYIPNIGEDPEQYDLNINQLTLKLYDSLAPSNPTLSKQNRLDYVLLDSSQGNYQGQADTQLLQQKGIQIIDTSLIKKQSSPFYHEQSLVEALLSMC